MEQQTRNFYTKAVLTVILAEQHDFILEKKNRVIPNMARICVYLRAERKNTIINK